MSVLILSDSHHIPFSREVILNFSSLSLLILSKPQCYLPISSSTGSPILAGDKNSGIYVSAGHSCWGITLSLGTGLCMSELILNGKVKSADVDDLMG